MMQRAFPVLLLCYANGDKWNLTSGWCHRWAELFYPGFVKTSWNTLHFVLSRDDSGNKRSRHAYCSFYRFCRWLFLQMPQHFPTISDYLFENHITRVSQLHSSIVSFMCSLFAPKKPPMATIRWESQWDLLERYKDVPLWKAEKVGMNSPEI